MQGVKILILQPQSDFDREEIYDRVEDARYAVEHVLTYSGTVPQVPYNQQLGRLFRRMRTDERDF